MSSHHFDTFLRESAEAIARQADPKLVVDVVGESLRRLLAGNYFLDEELTRPSPEGFARRELFRDETLSVIACVFAPQQSTPIHDHGGWGIIAGIANRLLVTTYRRLDDGLSPGFASLGEVTRTLVTESSWAFLRPPEESIHRVENPYREPAVTLHLFGSGGAQENLFDPRVKSILPERRPALAGV